jgi:2-oxoglutarate ferredoxin oxidoreductase subunit gamma
VVFNICMLGVVIGLTQLVRPESILSALQNRLPPKALDINRQALDLGLGMI